MDKIRVLHILYSFDIGVLEKGITMLVNNASRKFEHSILCMSASGDSKYLLNKNIPIIEMHKPPGNSINSIIRLAKKIKELNPDVIHTRNWSGVDGIIAARMAGCKVVVHGEHGWGMDDPQGAHPKRRFARRWLSLGVMEFTAVSQQIKTWLEEDVRVFRPVTQIYNGVDIQPLQGDQKADGLRRELGLADSTLLIGTVGRLDPIKDQAGLIRSFLDVHQQLPNCHLVLVGDGPERVNLEKLCVDGVHLLGMRSDVSSILQQLDVFVLPSLNEGISNTILEAMASGLPIVATTVGGTPELIEHESNGLLVEPGNYVGLAESMRRYLKSAELRNSHGSRNLEVINRKFSIKAMVAGYENVWERVSVQSAKPISRKAKGAL